MRYDAKVDENQPAIIEAARCWGASVLLLHRIGGGVPDLLLFYHGVYLLVEVKSPDGELNERQREWIDAWKGPVHVVRSISQLEKLLLSV